nr:hypothetical protein [Tanacetum cinerariifolium]
MINESGAAKSFPGSFSQRGYAECLYCGALYTGNFCCSKGSVEDKILVPKPPKNCARCAKCGHPVNGPYCQGCALLREKLEEDLVSCIKYFHDTSESSDDSTNVVNAPREPIVVKQDHGVKSSQNPPPIDECCCEYGNALDGIFCQQCICKSCGKGAHIGYNCPPKVPIIYASEEFDQIIDFLNASAIQYALTVNPKICVSCIKQFLSSVSVKKMNDVTRLQALIDRKKVIITEDTVREALRLDDAESIDCLPNEEIFTELARMGYEKPSTKLTLYKAFFSAQWNLVRNLDSSSKFYMYPRFLQLMIRAQVGDLSSHTIKYSSFALTQKQAAADVADEVTVGVDVDNIVVEDAAEPTIPSPTPTTQPPPPSQKLPSTSQVIPTPSPSPIAQTSSPPQQQQPSQPTHDAEISLDLLHTLLETYTVMDDQDDTSKQGEIIANIDADQDVTLKDVAVVAKDVEPTELKEVVEVVTTAKLMTEVVTAAPATIFATTTPITTATITAAPSAARRRKGVVIRDPEQTATPSTIIHYEPKSKDKGKGIMVQEPKPLRLSRMRLMQES